MSDLIQWYTKQNPNGTWSVLHADGMQAIRSPEKNWEPSEFPTQEAAREMLSALGHNDDGVPPEGYAYPSMVDARVEPQYGSGDESAPSPWQPIATAPRTGEHILVAWFDPPGGFGICGGKRQSAFDVVHWFGGPASDTWDEADNGFYPSNGPDVMQHPTHWMPLLEIGATPASPPKDERRSSDIDGVTSDSREARAADMPLANRQSADAYSAGRYAEIAALLREPSSAEPHSFICGKATGETPVLTTCGLPVGHRGKCKPLSVVMPLPEPASSAERERVVKEYDGLRRLIYVETLAANGATSVRNFIKAADALRAFVEPRT